MPLESNVVEKRTFYSNHAGLTICINPGRWVIGEDNRNKLVDHKLVSFTDMNNGGYGFLTTNDPEVIAKLETRDDVFGAEEFKNGSMSPQQRQSEAEATAKRVIEDNNRLLAKLAEQQAELDRVKNITTDDDGTRRDQGGKFVLVPAAAKK